MSVQQETHPVVASYVASPPNLDACLRGPGVPDAPIVKAMIQLRETIKGRRAPARALRDAHAVEILKADSYLCALFLADWAHVSCLQAVGARRGLQEAWPPLHQAIALLSDDTPPEVAAHVRTVEAVLAGAEGNHERRQSVLRRTIEHLPHTSPHRPHVLLQLARFLAEDGRLHEIDDEIPAVLHHQPGRARAPLAQLQLIRFVNAVEAGIADQALQFSADVSVQSLAAADRRLFERYTLLLGLMGPAALAPQDDGAAPREIPDWALVMRCLLSNHIHQALRWARLHEKNGPSSATSHDCTSFNLVRAELAEGNAEAARRLIEMRRSLGNGHYLDDLFLCRAELLAERRDAAAEHLAAVLKAVEEHHAIGRLHFELRLAPEISRDALLDITRAAEPLQSPTPALPQAQAPPAGTGAILGQAPAMARIRESIARFADLDVPVLITGETGTGKELVARALHESGHRNGKPFVAINCAAIPESLLESELFGHAKGAFTGAGTAHAGLFIEAGEGTLLLDEIGDIPPRLQVALLRVLETGEVRPVGSARCGQVACRMLASTNADLEQLVRKGQFRRDILFRLQRLRIHLPPLRDRAEDILPLAEHFLNEGRPAHVRAVLSSDLTHRLLLHHWPGNVRELKNLIERMRLMNSDKLSYDASDLDTPIGGTPPSQPSAEVRAEGHPGRPIRLSSRHRTGGRGKSRVRRLAALREMFRHHDLLTRGEIIEHTGISPNTATKDLRTLVEEGFVERVAPSASPRSVYFVLAKKKGE